MPSHPAAGVWGQAVPMRSSQGLQSAPIFASGAADKPAGKPRRAAAGPKRPGGRLDRIGGQRVDVVAQHRAALVHDHHRDDIEADRHVCLVAVRHVGEGDSLEAGALRRGVGFVRKATVVHRRRVHLDEDDARVVAGDDVDTAGRAFPAGFEDLVAFALEKDLGSFDCLAVEFFCVHG